MAIRLFVRLHVCICINHICCTNAYTYVCSSSADPKYIHQSMSGAVDDNYSIPTGHSDVIS